MTNSAPDEASDYNTKMAPDLGKHQARTARQIPVFMLTQQD